MAGPPGERVRERRWAIWPPAERAQGATSPGFLTVALVGPTEPAAGALAPHTVSLAHRLAQAGHEVTLVSWTGAGRGAAEEPFPRTVRSLVWNRPDTWLRTGRRLRAYDTVVLVHTGAATVPLHLALLRGAGVRSGGPRAVLVCEALLPRRQGRTTRNLVASVLGRVDGVLVHRRDEASLAVRLGAGRVYAVRQPEEEPPARVAPGLSAPWAEYVGVIEALAAGEAGAADPVSRTEPSPEPRRSQTALRRAAQAVRRPRRPGRQVRLTPGNLPDWLRPTDVLDDRWQAEEARDEARRLGLPRVSDGIAAWAALGALAAVLRVVEDGTGQALVVDESGPGSALTRWARACGYAPVDLGLTAAPGDPGDPEDPGDGRRYEVLDVDAGSLDVVARVHPGGCDASDVDEAVAQAAWVLRPGGIFILTLPLGRPGTDLAFGPADVRAVLARAAEHGFVLVGDLDGDTGRRLRAASMAAAEASGARPGAAYGLVRLTLRRR